MTQRTEPTMITHRLVIINPSVMNPSRVQKLAESGPGCDTFKYTHHSKTYGSNLTYDGPRDVYMFYENPIPHSPLLQLLFVSLGGAEVPKLLEYQNRVDKVSLVGNISCLRVPFEIVRHLKSVRKVEFVLGQEQQLLFQIRSVVEDPEGHEIIPILTTKKLFISTGPKFEREESKKFILGQFQNILKYSIKVFPNLEEFDVDLPAQGALFDIVTESVKKWEHFVLEHKVEIKDGRIRITKSEKAQNPRLTMPIMEHAKQVPQPMSSNESISSIDILQPQRKRKATEHKCEAHMSSKRPPANTANRNTREITATPRNIPVEPVEEKARKTVVTPSYDHDPRMRKLSKRVEFDEPEPTNTKATSNGNQIVKIPEQSDLESISSPSSHSAVDVDEETEDGEYISDPDTELIIDEDQDDDTHPQKNSRRDILTTPPRSIRTDITSGSGKYSPISPPSSNASNGYSPVSSVSPVKNDISQAPRPRGGYTPIGPVSPPQNQNQSQKTLNKIQSSPGSGNSKPKPIRPRIDDRVMEPEPNNDIRTTTAGSRSRSHQGSNSKGKSQPKEDMLHAHPAQADHHDRRGRPREQELRKTPPPRQYGPPIRSGSSSPETEKSPFSSPTREHSAEKAQRRRLRGHSNMGDGRGPNPFETEMIRQLGLERKEHYEEDIKPFAPRADPDPAVVYNEPLKFPPVTGIAQQHWEDKDLDAAQAGGVTDRCNHISLNKPGKGLRGFGFDQDEHDARRSSKTSKRANMGFSQQTHQTYDQKENHDHEDHDNGERHHSSDSATLPYNDMVTESIMKGGVKTEPEDTVCSNASASEEDSDEELKKLTKVYAANFPAYYERRPSSQSQSQPPIQPTVAAAATINVVPDISMKFSEKPKPLTPTAPLEAFRQLNPAHQKNIFSISALFTTK